MQHLLSTLSAETMAFASVCVGLLMFMFMERLPQGVDVLVALSAIRRNGKAATTAMAKRLLAALPLGESATLINVEDVGTRLAILEPKLASKYWRYHDQFLEVCLQVPPLCGIALTLWGMARDESLTAKTALLVPTILGVSTSIFAAFIMAATRWLDLATRLPAAAYRGALANCPAPTSKRRSVMLRAHASPVFLPVIFVVAYADLTQGLWIRERGNSASWTARSEVEDERSPEEQDVEPYLDVVLSRNGTASVMGVEIPDNAEPLADTVRAVVRQRVLDGLPTAAPGSVGGRTELVVSMRTDALAAAGVSLRLKALIQRELARAVREVHGRRVAVRFVEDLVSP